jgi:hypothetical protein
MRCDPASNGNGCSVPTDLASCYAELKHVDQALQEAEKRLHTAHIDYAQRTGPRPDSLYQDVVHLRQRSRRLLDRMAELFLARD